MSEIINLRRARKQAKRLKAEQQSAVNRLVHGRSKAERELERAATDKARRIVEQHRIEGGDKP
jgi:hypothetical protein